VCTPSSLVRERERKRERVSEKEGRERERERCKICPEFLFLEGMTGLLIPFSYLVF
jgi:hypothetical protein